MATLVTGFLGPLLPVQVKGAIKYYQNRQRIKDAEAGGGPLQTRVTAVEGRMTTTEGEIVTINGRVGDFGGRVDTIGGRMGDVDGRVNTVDGRMGGMEESLIDLRARIAVLEAAPSHQGRVAELERNLGPVNGFQGRIESMEKGVGPVPLLRERVGVMEEGLGSVSSLENRVKTLEAEAGLRPVLGGKNKEEIGGATMRSLGESMDGLSGVTAKLLNILETVAEIYRAGKEGSGSGGSSGGG
ncbi:hypothetical protein B9Z19DRAFT_1135483 [Tuber borchii]|uniref:Uncharacterized protein n=1 Tax=Tuber borchii TaxID=42251 RepID=A0A2T6ZCP9_TUBBO|nr:hypothetical protein B9Z19DRAFT_1135483 [Tuber borchii]